MLRIGRRRVTPPRHEHVGPEQQQIATVAVARDLVLHRQRRERRAHRLHRRLEPARISLRAGEPQQRVARIGHAILQRTAVAEPHLLQPRAGPCRRLVAAIERLRPAWLLPDHRRGDVAIAELGPDHLVGLALLLIRHPHQALVHPLPGGVRSRIPTAIAHATSAAPTRRSATRRRCDRRSAAARPRRRRAARTRPTYRASPRASSLVARRSKIAPSP